MRSMLFAVSALVLASNLSAQTEVIIRRPGEKDQVIRIDSGRAGANGLMAGRIVNGEFMRELRPTIDAMTRRLTEARVDSNLVWHTEQALRAPLAALENSARAAARRAHLGVTVDYHPRDTDRWGAYVTAVTPGSPAERGGIMSGDIIMRVAGKSLTENDAKSRNADESLPAIRLTTILADLPAGKTILVDVRRGTQTRTLKVTPDEGEFEIAMPKLFADSVVTGRLAYTGKAIPFATFNNGSSFGFAFGSSPLFLNYELAPMNEKLGSYFGTTEGVLVVNVNQRQWTVLIDSGRARARAGERGTANMDGNTPDAYKPRTPDLGLEPGDVIVSVDGRKVTSPSQLMRVVATYDHGDEFKLQIIRQKRAETLNVKVP